MKQIILFFMLVVSTNTYSQNKITVTINGKSINVQTKKAVVLKDGYYIETVIPKTFEEITKSMVLQEGKYKVNGVDQVVYATTKNVLYAIIKTEKGFLKIKIG